MQFFTFRISIKKKSMEQFYNFKCLIKTFTFLLIITSLPDCNAQKQHKQWEEVKLNSKISEDTIFSQLNKRKEILSGFEDFKTFKTRSSAVSYFTTDTEKFNLKDEYSKRMNNCRAFYFHSDTLSINIGISSGFSGWGFTISYKNKKFYVEPYYFVDIVTSEAKPTYKIVYQHLTLNKTTYKVGDSLYGNVDFKAIEFTNDNLTFEHYGKGYFRAKIRKI